MCMAQVSPANITGRRIDNVFVVLAGEGEVVVDKRVAIVCRSGSLGRAERFVDKRTLTTPMSCIPRRLLRQEVSMAR